MPEPLTLRMRMQIAENDIAVVLAGIGNLRNDLDKLLTVESRIANQHARLDKHRRELDQLRATTDLGVHGMAQMRTELNALSARVEATENRVAGQWARLDETDNALAAAQSQLVRVGTDWRATDASKRLYTLEEQRRALEAADYNKSRHIEELTRDSIAADNFAMKLMAWATVWPIIVGVIVWVMP